MDFELPPDTLMLRDMLRRFVQKEARPLEMKYFNTGELTPEERARLRKAVEQLGLWGVLAPEQFGGGGLDLVTACVVEEELGKTFIPVEMGNVPPMLYACSGDQVGRFLEPALAGERRAILAAREPGSEGLLPSSWKTSAAASGDDYLLEGSKLLSERPDAQDFYIVYAQCPGGLTAFLLEAGAEGLSLSSNNEQPTLTLRQCRASAQDVLGEVGRALALGAEEAPQACIRMGARCVGLAERLAEMAAEHARDWVSLGAPLSVRPAIQRMLAETRVEVECSRWLVYHAAWLADSGHHDQIRVAAAQVRLASGEMLQRAVDRATMIFAGPGPSPQIEPRRIVRSRVPGEALAIALDHARAIVAAEALNLPRP